MSTGGVKDSLKSHPQGDKLGIFRSDKNRRFFCRGRDKTVNYSIGAGCPLGPQFCHPQQFRRPKAKISRHHESRENRYQDTGQLVPLGPDHACIIQSSKNLYKGASDS
jgi:hypothetical protein